MTVQKRRRTDAARRLSVVIDRVRADLAYQWTVSEMASVVGVTGSQLRRLSAETGRPSPRRLLADLRLATAAELLADPGVRVKEVTARVGIADGSHFCREFRRRYGMSPSEYRERQS
jgi:AraC-like DNA-binding protein